VKNFRIACIQGDGIGKEVIPAGQQVRQALRDHEAILFGSAGAPEITDHLTLWGLRLKICQGFDQYANGQTVS
jgi:tartrate dehydrogenase/decarboxylase/D-malate dehydrogenase